MLFFAFINLARYVTCRRQESYIECRDSFTSPDLVVTDLTKATLFASISTTAFEEEEEEDE